MCSRKLGSTPPCWHGFLNAALQVGVIDLILTDGYGFYITVVTKYIDDKPGDKNAGQKRTVKRKKVQFSIMVGQILSPRLASMLAMMPYNQPDVVAWS
eukprot:jgi/Chrzof1/446/Cz01g16050.t1